MQASKKMIEAFRKGKADKAAGRLICEPQEYDADQVDAYLAGYDPEGKIVPILAGAEARYAAAVAMLETACELADSRVYFRATESNDFRVWVEGADYNTCEFFTETRDALAYGRKLAAEYPGRSYDVADPAGMIGAHS